MNAYKVKRLKMFITRLREQFEFLDQIHSEERDAYNSLSSLDKFTDFGDSLLESSSDLAAISSDLARVIYRVNKLISHYDSV